VRLPISPYYFITLMSMTKLHRLLNYTKISCHYKHLSTVLTNYSCGECGYRLHLIVTCKVTEHTMHSHSPFIQSSSIFGGEIEIPTLDTFNSAGIFKMLSSCFQTLAIQFYLSCIGIIIYVLCAVKSFIIFFFKSLFQILC
jgi:hypothetical protein